MATSITTSSTDGRARNLALVIGISDYQEGKKLPNAVNDAKEMSAALERMGFLIHDNEPKLNLKYKEMRDILRAFADSIKAGDMVLFYFTGHGRQWEDQNYLIPADNVKRKKTKDDVKVEIALSGSDLKKHAIDAQDLLNAITGQNPFVTIFLLDCCRPYHLRNKDLITPEESEEDKQPQGLKQMSENDRSLIVFACGPGSTADDGGKGDTNSLFTKYLLKHIMTPNKDIQMILSDVIDGVKTESKSVQIPHVRSVLHENVYLFEQAPASPTIKINEKSETTTNATVQKNSQTPKRAMPPTTNNNEHANTKKENVTQERNVRTGNTTSNARSGLFDWLCRLVSPSNAANNQVANDPSTSCDATPKGPKHDEPPSDGTRHPSCQFRADKKWLDPQYHDGKNSLIKKPGELENDMDEPTGAIDEGVLDRIQGSILGLALGDSLGAHVEFRPRQFLVQHPVADLGSGGTWGLSKGQFTDDTSMALCLANSLIANRGFNPYDQLVRYKWWYKLGYMSSTGQCFDIGAATRQSIQEFEYRQKTCAKDFNIPFKQMDYLSDPELLKHVNVYCSEEDVAGNGALMRLAPVPLFFYRNPAEAVELSGRSGQITHGDRKAYDACRYYGALIVAALRGYEKKQLLDKAFYSKHKEWFGKNKLHPDIESIAKGSYKKKNGYDDGIRGKGYIVNALEAALWAFWSDENSFEKGALAAVNLGDDTDTTAAIYGQLAGAYYGYKQLPPHWLQHVYGRTFMEKLSKWIAYEGECWQKRYEASASQS